MKIGIQVAVGQVWWFLAPGDILSMPFSMELLIPLSPEFSSVHREGKPETQQANTSQLGPQATSILPLIARRGTAPSGWEPYTLEIPGRCYASFLLHAMQFQDWWEAVGRRGETPSRTYQEQAAFKKQYLSLLEKGPILSTMAKEPVRS